LSLYSDTREHADFCDAPSVYQQGGQLGLLLRLLLPLHWLPLHNVIYKIATTVDDCVQGGEVKDPALPRPRH